MKLLLFLAIVVSTMSASCMAQEKTAPEATDLAEKIRAAADQAGLETPTTPPFHLVADFQMFDSEGKPDGQGSLDLYRDPKLGEHKVLTLGGAKQVSTSTPSGNYSTPQLPESRVGSTLITALLTPGLETGLINDSSLSVKDFNLGELVTKCLVLQPQSGSANATANSVFAPHAYCLGVPGTRLRVVQLPPSTLIGYNGFAAFGPKMIPHRITLWHGTMVRGQLTVQTLEPWVADSAILTPQPDAQRVTPNQTSGIVLGKIITKVAAVYPAIAKAARVSGPVVLYVTIDSAGHVRDPEVVDSPSPALSASAIEAVKQWIYQPSFFQGVAVAIDTSIVVYFVLPATR